MERQYPEHDKLRAVKDKSQTVGEFIEWLGENGFYICERVETQDPRPIEVPSPDSRKAERLGDAFFRVMQSIADNQQLYWPTSKRLPNSLLAKFFDIDENRLESEKRTMLDELRKMNEEKA